MRYACRNSHNKTKGKKHVGLKFFSKREKKTISKEGIGVQTNSRYPINVVNDKRRKHMEAKSSNQNSKEYLI